MQYVNIYKAIGKMRKLSDMGISFSFKFIAYNSSTGVGGQVKCIDKAVLRAGYAKKYSDKSEVLVAYTDCDTNKDRQFYLPLLIEFNGYKVKP